MAVPAREDFGIEQGREIIVDPSARRVARRWLQLAGAARDD